MTTIHLHEYENQVFSQFGQDGVLDKIFETIGTTNKYFVEFGSNGTDTGVGNSIYLRKERGFNGLLMDGRENPEAIYDLQNEFIAAENINELLEKHEVPSDFDFLSIDIDGEDFYVMKAIDLDKFRPRVISIETNAAIIPPNKLVQRHDKNWTWGGWHFHGCGISAITELMNSLDYSLVAYCGVDAIFINNEEAKYFQNINNIEKIYEQGVVNKNENEQTFNRYIKENDFFISTDDIQ